MRRWLWRGDSFHWRPIAYLAALTCYAVVADVFWRMIKLPGTTSLAIVGTAGIVFSYVIYRLARRIDE